MQISAKGTRFKEDMFQTNLGNLFDIAHKDVMTSVKNEEDRYFLSMSSPASCSMAGADLNQARRESRRQVREEAEARRREKVMNTSSRELSASDEEETEAALSDDASDDEYESPST